MADGNFKADHVRQKNEVDDVWLSEGCGMIPSRHEYLSFLATAIEKLTVSLRLSTITRMPERIRIPVPDIKNVLRRMPLVKTLFVQLQMPYKPQSFAI